MSFYDNLIARLKSIRQSPTVGYQEALPAFNHREFQGAVATLLYGAGQNLPFYLGVLTLKQGALRPELADGVIIGSGVLEPGERQVAQSQQNDKPADDKFLSPQHYSTTGYSILY